MTTGGVCCDVCGFQCREGYCSGSVNPYAAGYAAGAPQASFPPPPPALRLRRSEYETSYLDSPARRKIGVDTLIVEKAAFLGLYVLNAVISVFMACSAIYQQAPAAGAGDVGPFADSIFGSLVIGCVIGFFIWRGVLFGHDTLLKWSCAGCSVLLIAVLGWSLFSGVALMQGVGAGGSTPGGSAAVVLSIAAQAWLISILVRDARRVEIT